jgi:hypothetical protein
MVRDVSIPNREWSHITLIKDRQFLTELKDYIEESNEGVTS